VLVNRSLELRKHVCLRGLQVFDASVHIFKLVRQFQKPLLLALLDVKNLELIVEVPRMLQCLVAIPNGLCLLKLLY
jgi:hypothetical protein